MEIGIPTIKIPRNTPCPCGCGRKSKHHLGANTMLSKGDNAPEEKVKAINQNGLNSLLWKLIATAGGKITVPLTDLSLTPDGAKFYSKFDETAQSFEIWVDMPHQSVIVPSSIKEPMILTPNELSRRRIVGG